MMMMEMMLKRKGRIRKLICNDVDDDDEKVGEDQ